MSEINSIYGVDLDTWLDLKIEIEAQGYTVEQFVELLRSDYPWGREWLNLPNLLSLSREKESPADRFDEWLW